MTPGIYYGLSMAEYLAIPALSSGVARKMIDECAARAWFDSYLNQSLTRDDTPATDRGTIAHDALLEGGLGAIEVIDPADYPAQNNNIPFGWTNNAIRAARDAARAGGKIPMLAKDYAGVCRMVTAAQGYIQGSEEPALRDAFSATGESEVTMVWDEDGVLCKLRADRVNAARTVVVDYKTTDMSADPARWGRSQMINMGYYFQAAWYRRGVAALHDGRVPAFLFLAQEAFEPYLASTIGCDPVVIQSGDVKVEYALRRWRECLQLGLWPAYPARAAYPEMPAWELARIEAMEIEAGL